MRVLVCGGREYKDKETIWAMLDMIHAAITLTCVIHGGARGADSIAGQWAQIREIEESVYPANWNSYGRAAGPLRNKQMIDSSKPHLVLAFQGGRGTRDLLLRALDLGIHTIAIGKFDETPPPSHLSDADPSGRA